MLPNTINKVAIIGCGWLGFPLAQTLLHSGHQIIATRSSKTNARQSTIAGIPTIDLSLQPSMDCDSFNLLHSADIAIILLPPRTQMNIGGPYIKKICNLSNTLKAGGLNKIIFVSSTSVYPLQNRFVDETESIAPRTLTGQALFEAEYALLQDKDLYCTIIRFAGLCGPDREPGKLLAGRHNVRGGENPVNLIHQQDAIDILITLINHQPWGEIFNGCAPMHPKKTDLYPKAAKNLGLDPPTFDTTTSRYKLVSTEKICHLLGFNYRHPDPMLW